MRKILSMLVASMLAFAASFVIVNTAQATPANCNGPKVKFTHTTSKVLKTTSTSTCQKSATRTIVAEIKWDKNAAPDPLTAKNSKLSTATEYSVSVSSCDKGNTRGYYGRGYFTGDSDYHDTPVQKVKACS
jgi:hypothetical protein